MPYKVLQQEVQILKPIGEIKTPDGKIVAIEHKSEIHFKDDVIEDNEISPIIVKAYEDGDEHTRHILKKVTAAQVARAAAKQTEDED